MAAALSLSNSSSALVSSLPTHESSHTSSSVACPSRQSSVRPCLVASATPQFHFPADEPEMSAARLAMDPSSQFANVLWGKGTYNTQILVGEGENTESVVRRFKKACLEANIVNECRRRRFFETTQDIKKRKQKDAARLRKRISRSSGGRGGYSGGPAGGPRPAAPAKKGDDDDDDFWDAEVEL